MFKKLSNLLFEEDEDYVEDEEVEEEYVKPQTKKPAKVEPKVEPVYEEPVVQAPPVQSYFRRQEEEIGAVQEMPKITLEPKVEPVKPVEKPKPLGIQVDEVATYKRPERKEEPAYRSLNPSTPKKQVTVEKKTGYERKPIISPIFGISEKDTAGLVSSSTAKKKSASGKVTSGVISPMYGLNLEKEVVEPVVEPTVKKEVKEEKVFEDDLPVFSLEDILTSNDDNTKPFSLFDDDPKEENDITKVMKTKNFSLFDDDEY